MFLKKRIKFNELYFLFFGNLETQDSTLVDILNFVKVQRQYHQDCVSKLDGIISDITKIHKSNRWNAIRDHKLGIQAYICVSFKMII